MKNKTYCAAAFNQIYSDSSAKYRLCCYARPNEDDPSSLDVLPFDYFYSEAMNQIRQDMIDGKEIAGCDKCYLMENSYRDKYNNLYDLKLEPDKVHLKLRIFGSFCNLGCYMCHPYNSSKRREHLAFANIDTDDWDHKANNLSIQRFRVVLDHIIENIEYIESIHITGGEPLQMPNTWALLREIVPTGWAQRIDLYIDTNLTELGEIMKYARHFNSISLGVSSDHFGDQLKWIRYPINVDIFNKNLEEAEKLIDHIQVAVSILNIEMLNEIKEHYKKYKVEFNVVENPEMLSIKNLPPSQKQLWIEKYSDLPAIVEELSKPPDLVQLLKGITYCVKLNKKRGMNLTELFPNLKTWRNLAATHIK